MIKYIPTSLTAGNLLCGFLSIMIADFYWGPILLLGCFLFDSFDGVLARKLNAQSDFGKQMDSLADVISFGAAPAYYYSLISPDPGDRLVTMLACGMIVLAGTIRLAKFNISPSKPYFMGLPIPANAVFYIGIMIAFYNKNEMITNFFSSKVNYVGTSLFLSAMMLSFGLRMFSTKGMTKNWRDNIYQYIMFALTFVIVIRYGFASVSLLVLAYIFLSIINTLTSRAKEKVLI